jgi:hypothetical protein
MSFLPLAVSEPEHLSKKFISLQRLSSLRENYPDPADSDRIRLVATISEIANGKFKELGEASEELVRACRLSCFGVLSTQYQPEKARTIEDVQKCARKILRDFEETEMGVSLRRSFRGVASGATLVRYREPSRETSYVGKWTSPIELLCQHIYHALIAAMPPSPEKDCMHLPAAVMLKPIPPYTFQRVDRTESVPAERIIIPPCLMPSDHPDLPRHPGGEAFQFFSKNDFMISATAPGRTILDFIGTQYGNLPAPEKACLFRQLGRIAMLDLFLGNHDRLLKLEDRDEDGSEHSDSSKEELVSNLGNLMLNTNAQGVLQFGLIDNGCNIERSSKYLAAIARDLREDPELSSRELAQTMVRQIEKALETAKFPREDDLSEELAEFRTEMEGQLPALQEGIQSMATSLQASISPWRASEEFRQLSAYLQRTPVSRPLLQGLERRMTQFSNVELTKAK